MVTHRGSDAFQLKRATAPGRRKRSRCEKMLRLFGRFRISLVIDGFLGKLGQRFVGGFLLGQRFL